MEYEAIVPVLVLLGAGIIGVGIAKAARLSPLIGFFISGAAVGPHALGWVPESDAVKLLADVGIAFFLFEVGLSVSLKRMATSWKELFVLGPLQIICCTIGLGLLATLFGIPWRTAVLLGAVLSLSSTAVVLRLLQSHSEATTPVGQRITSILVFQDLVAVVLLALIAAASQPSAGIKTIAITLATMTVGLVAVVGLGRWLLQPFLRWVIALNAGEVVTGASIFAVLTLSWMGSHAGLSIPLGAFLAGVCLAESRYGYVVQSELAPFRMLFLSLFFLTVGFRLDPAVLIKGLPLILAITIGAMLVKFIFTTLSQLLAGVSLGPAIRAGAVLSQGSEFAFIVAAAGFSAGLFNLYTVEMLTAAVVISLALTPLAGWAGCVLSRKLVGGATEAEPLPRDDGEVIIVEFDEYAWELTTLLTRASIPYRGHDRDWGRILLARSRGFDVHYSDPERPRTLSRAATGLARAVVVLVEDRAIIDLLINGLRRLDTKLPILAATRDLVLFEYLNGYSLTAVYIKNPETVRPLAIALLEALGLQNDALTESAADPEKAHAARAA